MSIIVITGKDGSGKTTALKNYFQWSAQQSKFFTKADYEKEPEKCTAYGKRVTNKLFKSFGKTPKRIECLRYVHEATCNDGVVRFFDDFCEGWSSENTKSIVEFMVNKKDTFYVATQNRSVVNLVDMPSVQWVIDGVIYKYSNCQKKYDDHMFIGLNNTDFDPLV